MSDPTVIGVNAKHPPTRQRFTIAHEIAHHVLHASAAFHVDNRIAILRRDPKSSEGTDHTEIEANVFAAELLMPSSLLATDLVDLRTSDLDDETEVKQLAKRYNVSPQAMTFRLANLGYVQI